MQRWHKLARGRIVASCECATGDAAEVLLAPVTPEQLIVTDAMWRGTMYRKALVRHGRPTMGAEQWHHELKRRANEVTHGV